MATGSILLGMALLVLTGLFIARPFMRPRNEEGDLTEYQLLQEEKEHLLDQIQALDFDLDTGKIPAEVHQLQRARLMEDATAVLKSIDRAGGDGEDTAIVPDAVDMDIEIEAAIARIRQQRRHKKSAPAPTVSVATNGHARFCSQCGTPTDPDDRFCANCGHKLTLESSTKTA
ncbi:MAG: zinc-ribbon domain-containing protein [Anaerolineales bacterium]|nr:zinc-ribbon domain-containing protein [Anaerolineales bacterium]MCB8939411.1 zinc-ribbon domain-containing protein [Ardenticatenaceae bacterium]